MKDVRRLVYEAQGGNTKAFESLIKRFQDMVFILAYVKVKDECLAEDVAQETFIEAFLHLDSLREPGAFAGWLRQITLRQCSRILRRKSVEVISLAQATGLLEHNATPIDKMLDIEAQQVLREVIESLPEPQCTAILLHYISGYSQNEIAAFSDVPVNTISKRLQYARERLKEKIIMMKEDYFERKPSKDETFSRRIRFFLAVQSGKVEEVRSILNQDSTLVVERQKYSETMAQLLPHRILPDEETLKFNDELGREGWTPLIWAVKQGHVEMAELLLKKGALSTETSNNTSVLYFAAQEGYSGIVAMLLEREADPNNTECDQNGSPLHIAVGLGWTKIVELLLQHGADIERHDQVQRTPLCWAAISGSYDMVSLLMRHGAKSETIDQIGWTPMRWAEQNKHSSVVQALQRQIGSDNDDSPDLAKGGRSGDVTSIDHEVMRNDFAGAVMAATTLSTKELQKVEPLRTLMEAPHKLQNYKKQRLFETGIKGIDLLAPVPLNGSIVLHTSWGIGSEVMLQELARTVKVNYGGHAIIIAMQEMQEGSTFQHKVEIEQAHYRILGVLDAITALLIPSDASAEVQRNAIVQGLAIAYELLGTDDSVVLFAVDHLLLETDTWSTVQRVSAAVPGSMLTVVTGYNQDENHQTFPIETDACIGFNAGKPTVDLFRSTSAFLESNVLDELHKNLSKEVRRILQIAEELIPNDNGSEALLEGHSRESSQLIERARRLRKFLTQPLFSLQIFTGVPGEEIPLHDTLAGCKAILAGEYDHVPLDAFDHTGTIDQVVAKAKSV